MPYNSKKTLTNGHWLRAYEARKPTAKHAAVLAVFRVLEDRLEERMGADRIDGLGYTNEGIERISVDARGRVHVSFETSYSFELPLVDLLAGCQEAPDILALFKRKPERPVS
jgi:hypothetical protein